MGASDAQLSSGSKYNWRQWWGVRYGELRVTPWKEWLGQPYLALIYFSYRKIKSSGWGLNQKRLTHESKGKPESGYWHSDWEGEAERNLRPIERWKCTWLEVKVADTTWLNVALRFEVWQNGDATVSKEESVGGDVAEGDTRTQFEWVGTHGLPYYSL